MAASSSAKFFVHQNQNKANSSSASPAFAADSDVVEFTKFRSGVNEAEKIEKHSFFNKNENNNAFDNNCRRRRSEENNLERPHKSLSPKQQGQVNCSRTLTTAAATDSASTGIIAPEIEVDIEEAITRTTQISFTNISCTSGKNTIERSSVSVDGAGANFQSLSIDENSPNSSDHETIDQPHKTGYTYSPKNCFDSTEYQINNNNSVSCASKIRNDVGITNIYGTTNLKEKYDHNYQQQIINQTENSTPFRIIKDCVSPLNAMNTSQQTQAVPGNRITFTSQTLPNGTINIGSGHPSGSTIISTSQLPNTTTIKTITSSAAGGVHHALPQQVQVQHHQVLQSAQAAQQQPHNPQSVGATQTQTLVIKSNHAVSLPAGLVSSAPGIVTMTKTINQGNQPIINSMIPASVVVGMRPQNTQNQQKNVQGNTLGRVVIGPHMVGSRPQSPAITLSTLTPGQAPALILKTENGFQLLRVGTATSGPVTQTIGTNSTNSTIRLQTVPAASSSMATTSSSNNIVNSVSSTNSAPHVLTSQANISLHQPQQSSALSTSSVATITGMQHQQQQQLHQQQQIHQQVQHLHTQPQITQVQTIPPQQPQQQQVQQINSNSGVQNAPTVTAATQSAQGNTKEKCRKFLANLIDLSTREPKPVEKNVRNLIQELVNANVEPEEFCDRLERLLNASPQPCLIGFLRKSLPLLRQALYSKELVIEGIKPPPQHVVGISALTQQLPKIQAQIRPISQNQTTTIGQTQVRMISPSGAPRPVGHTTITKQQGGSIRIQTPASAPRLLNTQLRVPLPSAMQPLQQQQLHTNSPHLQPAHPNIVQIRTPTISRPATVQIRTAKGKTTTASVAGAGITHVKVGQTQIKAISSPQTTSSQPPLLTSISNASPSLALMSAPSTSSILSTINSVATNSLHASSLHHTLSGNNGMPNLPTPSLPTVQLPPHLTTPSINATIDFKSDRMITVSPGTTPTLISGKPAKIASNSASKPSSKKRKDQQDKEKDDRPIVSSAAAAATSFFQQPSISMSSSMYGDDDINDVAAMGGVNLAEESQRILGCTENIGTQIRSCKDEVFLHLPSLQARIRATMLERGLEEPSQDVAVLISHACQERLKNVVEKLAVIAEHRIDVIKLDSRYEVTKDVRGQIKFLEELDKAEQKRHEELEREMLLRAAKSRSKIEDPEQAKMKARAKEMQRAEMEELRQRDANMTALQAIGPRKKLKLDSEVATASGSASGVTISIGSGGAAPAPKRPRIKRVNLRDMLFFLEQERDTCRSQMLYEAYLK